jgi:hypothetical protein
VQELPDQAVAVVVVVVAVAVRDGHTGETANGDGNGSESYANTTLHDRISLSTVE